MSGPMELGGAVSGPLDSSSFSGPIDGKNRKKKGIPVMFRRSMSEKNRMSVVPLRSLQGKKCENDEIEIDDAGNGKVEWARGRAGEDRAHVLVSESQKWLFVGIYDGFNGPEAPEFLVENLYKAVFDEFKGLLWQEDRDNEAEIANADEVDKVNSKNCRKLWEFLEEDKELEFSGSGRFAFSMSRLKRGFGSWRKEEKLKEVKEVSRFSTVKRRRRKVGPVSDHGLVLRALERALSVTENAYFELVDRVKDFNPELAVMGSCVLVVLTRDDDVYVMNLGDSRAVVAQFREKGVQENCEDGDKIEGSGRGDMELAALQLSTDHSTSVEEEIIRIRELHPDDNRCIVNGRVKGRLNVTRAFGAGYLKHPRWNDGLLAIFQNEYIGNAPYLSSTPSLYHHKLSANDQFMVLSSDGLYQYLSNEEVVSYVENFMETFPDGDPAQKLVEELLSRAAQKYGTKMKNSASISLFNKWELEPPIANLIAPTCFHIFREMTNFRCNNNFLQRAIELLDDGKFVFGKYSLYLGLEDIYNITGLPVDGKPIVCKDFDSKQLIMEMLGEDDPNRKESRCYVRKVWLKDKFEKVPDEILRENNEGLLRYARAYILFMMGTILFSDN